MTYYPDRSRSFFCILLCVLLFIVSALSSLAYEGDAAAKMTAFGVSTAVLLVVYVPAIILAVKFRKREIHVGEFGVTLSSILPKKEISFSYAEAEKISFRHRKNFFLSPRMIVAFPDGKTLAAVINADIMFAVEKAATCPVDSGKPAEKEDKKQGAEGENNSDSSDHPEN